MDCQDCGKKMAGWIVFNMEDEMFFAVCSDCIGVNDKVLDADLLKKFSEVV